MNWVHTLLLEWPAKLRLPGQTSLEIADEMFVSEKTVKNHLANIFRKLGVKNRSHAVSEGYKQGLLN